MVDPRSRRLLASNGACDVAVDGAPVGAVRGGYRESASDGERVKCRYLGALQRHSVGCGAVTRKRETMTL